MRTKISRAFELAFKVFRADISVTFSLKKWLILIYFYFFGLFLQNVSLILKIC